VKNLWTTKISNYQNRELPPSLNGSGFFRAQAIEGQPKTGGVLRIQLVTSSMGERL